MIRVGTNNMVKATKLAFETQDFSLDTKKKKITEIFTGNRPGSMSIARSYGLTPKKEEWFWSAEREVTDKAKT